MHLRPCCANDARAVAWLALLATLLLAATSDHFTVGPRGTIVAAPPVKAPRRADEVDPTSFFGSAAAWSDGHAATTGGGGGIFAGGGASAGRHRKGGRAVPNKPAPSSLVSPPAAAAAAAADAADAADASAQGGGSRSTTAHDHHRAATEAGSTPAHVSGSSDASPSSVPASHSVPAFDAGAVIAPAGGQAGVFSLAKVSATQAFYLTPQGQLMERFFNGHTWTYAAHSPPYPGASLTALSGVLGIEDRDTALHYVGYLYASDAEGRLFRAVQRRYFNTVVGNGTGSWQLEWVDISWDDYRIFSGGVLGGQTSPKVYFFADADGRLLERTVQTPSVVERAQLKAANDGQKQGDQHDVGTTPRVGRAGTPLDGRGRGDGGGGALREEQHHLWKSHGSPPGSHCTGRRRHAAKSVQRICHNCRR